MALGLTPLGCFLASAKGRLTAATFSIAVEHALVLHLSSSVIIHDQHKKGISSEIPCLNASTRLG